MKIEYREANQKDITNIGILHNDLAYYIQEQTKDPYWNFKTLSIDGICSHLNSYLNNDTKRIYIALDGNLIIGFIAGEIIRCHLPISEVGDIGYISSAFVKDQYRGKRIMTVLENKIVHFFKESNIKYVELNFLTNNINAKKAWGKLGYLPYREQVRKEI